MSSFDLIGVGSPIMDITANVPESFLSGIAGGKGGMVLVDTPEMEALLARLPAPPTLSTGGSAANATFNAARLGLRSTFLGKLGADAPAAVYREQFTAAGVDPGRFKSAPLPNARCLALITPDAQRTMRTCLAAALTLDPAEISPADFAGCRHAHVEGYLVFNPALATAVLAAARAAGCTLSLDLASYEMIAISRPWLFEQFAAGLDVVFANEDEIRTLFEDTVTPYPDLARRLAALGPIAAVKLGADGAWLATPGGDLHRVEPVRVPDAIDTNGAGDAWAAGFLSGYLRDRPLPECGARGSHLGAETVRHPGPLVPPAHWPALAARLAAL